jgi:Crinkler effector protein N-terminal domain
MSFPQLPSRLLVHHFRSLKVSLGVHSSLLSKISSPLLIFYRQASTTSDKISLYCLVKGQPFRHAFRIDASSGGDVDSLRELIKEKKRVELKDVDSEKIIVYKTSIPAGDTAALDEAYRQAEKEDGSELCPADIIGEVFPSPIGRHIHVIAKIPGMLLPALPSFFQGICLQALSALQNLVEGKSRKPFPTV